MKKINYSIFLVIEFVLLFSSMTYAASWEHAEEIQRGVEYKRILKYNGSGFSKIHVIECDLADPSVSIGVLTASKGSSYLENTKKMAENSGALAAINGDFFNSSSTRTNMLGVVYQDGEMVSTPSKDLWATFAITDTGNILMDYFGFEGKVISPQGYEVELYQINKVPSTGGAVNMFTDKWGKTVYCNDNMAALVIKDGVVTNKISKKGDIDFDENDTILLTNYTVNGFFDNFNIGDTVTIEYSLTGTDENFVEATGGNTLLVSDGKKADFTHNATGYAQRSAIGIDSSGQKLILAVCEGRQTAYKGMTQEQMANAMIELGCIRAINLDGGGSSTIVTKNNNTGLVDVKNNVTSLRNVSTSVGVFNKSEYIGIPVSGDVSLSGENVLKGDYIDVYYKFVDENAHVVQIENKNELQISTTDSSAVIVDNRITFNTEGEHKIYVSFKGVTLESRVYVINNIASAYIYPEAITISKGKTANVGLTVWDIDGRMAYVHPENVNWVSEGVKVNSGVVEYGVGYVGFETEGVSAYSSINNGISPEKRFKNTKFMTNEPTDGKVIRISAGSGEYTSIANMIRMLNYEYSLKGSDELYMFKKPLISDLKYNPVNVYSEKGIGNTRIVTLNSSTGSINKNNQLSKIINIPNISEKNIIIITEKLPSALSEDEKIIYTDSINKAKNNGKNVFLVYKDLKTHSYLENGIYYIGCGSVNGTTVSGGNTFFEKNKVINFYISEDKISYSLTN